VQVSLDKFHAKHRKQSDQLDLIRRLAALDADDVRMLSAHNVLRKELLEDAQWLRYFAAAYSSMRDYSGYRNRKREAAELLGAIGEQCSLLIKSIRQVQRTGIDLPSELCYEGTTVWGGDESYTALLLQMFTVAQTKERPQVVQVLCKVSDAADRALRSITFGGDIDAAISKQKPILKTEYLRAFEYLLTREGGIVLTHWPDDSDGVREIDLSALPEPIDRPVTITPGVRRAMAITATVALNNDVEVSEDDVRKALCGLEDTSANSSRNHPKRRKI
jgi:hypothetical protein